MMNPVLVDIKNCFRASTSNINGKAAEIDFENEESAFDENFIAEDDIDE